MYDDVAGGGYWGTCQNYGLNLLADTVTRHLMDDFGGFRSFAKKDRTRTWRIKGCATIFARTYILYVTTRSQ